MLMQLWMAEVLSVPGLLATAPQLVMESEFAGCVSGGGASRKS
jgi:hypothetical protein